MSGPAVLVDLPQGDGPFPVLVLAPGQRYHMAMPLLAQVAAACVRRGIAVVRFDWSAPSPADAAEPESEQQDLQAVVERVRGDARFDARQLWVGGKSLGSVIAWRQLRVDAALRGAVLLTPLCTHGDLYAGLEGEQRPLFLLAGDADPHCEPAALDRLAGRAGGVTRVQVVSGGHDLVDARSPDNLQLAGSLVADFLAENAGVPSAAQPTGKGNGEPRLA